MALYVVTGGAGFIGSHLVDALLADGHSVRVLDDLSAGCRENLDARADLVVGDVADPALVRRAVVGAAGCFHLAAAPLVRGTTDWLGSHRSNLTGTIAVLDAARVAGGFPVVYASSAAVYGDRGAGALTEGSKPIPCSPYGADTYGCELHAGAAFAVHGVPTAGLRLFNVYGPRWHPASRTGDVVSIFASRIAAGVPITIHGDGRQVRDFVFVRDAVCHMRAAMARLHDRPGAYVFNVCTGRATSVLALAQTIGAVVGRAGRIGFGPARAGDVPYALGDPTLARAALGVAAGTALPDGLARTLVSGGVAVVA